MIMFRYRVNLDQQLITEIESRPILWNKTLCDYRKTTLRDAAWKEVARALQISISECKRRWRTLRDSFVKYHRSRNESGNGVDLSRKRMWIFYDIMSFLIPHIEARESMLDNPENADDMDLDDLGRDIKKIDPSMMSLEFAESSNNPLDMDDFSGDGRGTPEQFPLRNNPQKRIDPDEQFLLSYVPVLKRLSPQKNAQARLKIQQVLYEIEFGTQEDFVQTE